MYTCISCGEELDSVVCRGTIGGVSVSFCEEDAKDCENCEHVSCVFVDEI